MNESGVSVVVPFLNEEDGILIFCKTFDDFVKQLNFPIELILVDDGSTDNTLNLILSYVFTNVNEVKVIRFTRNFGFQAAVRAGILKAKYDICTWISVDLQEPLELIPCSYKKLLLKQVDIVYVEKERIVVNPISRSFSKIFYLLMKKYAIKNYPQKGIGAVLFNRKVIDYLNDNIETNSAILLQLLDAGFHYCSIPMQFSARECGKSRWTLSKKIKIFIDSFVSFSYMPIRLVSLLGVFMLIIGLVTGIITVYNKLSNPFILAGYSTIVSVLALGFGITNISLGIIAEYLWRTLEVSRQRPAFIISEEIVIRDEENDGHLDQV